MVEMDVQLCKTGEVVLSHDVVHSSGEFVWNMGLDELQRHGIDTLTSFFSAVYAPGRRVMLDVKGRSTGVVAAIFDLLSQHVRAADAANVCIGSFHQAIVAELVGRKSAYQVGLITSSVVCDDPQLSGLDFLSVDLNALFSETKSEWTCQVFAYTFRRRVDVEMAERLGIDGLISDVLL